MVKADSKSSGQEVKADWKADNKINKRRVIVGGLAAFEQSPEDLSGSFCGPYSSLSLPF